MAKTARLRIRRALEDRARLRIDDLIARRPPGSIADDPARRLVLPVQCVQEARVGPHLDACCLETEQRAVCPMVGTTERDEIIDLAVATQILDVIAGRQRAHRVSDDVHFRRAVYAQVKAWVQ